MSNECHLFFCTLSRFRVKHVSSSNERFAFPEISIHSVNRSCLFFAIDGHSLIETILSPASEAKDEAKVLVFSINNFNCIFIYLFHTADCFTSCVQVIHESPACGLSPTNSTSKMVLVDGVFPSLRSEAHHVVANNFNQLYLIRSKLT